jgi:hypothetical protein
MAEEIKLGDSVTFSIVLVRKEQYVQKDVYRKTRRKVWANKHVPETTGIIVGKRTLSNGNTSYDSDAGWMYAADEYFPAYLVAFDLKKSPVLIHTK